MENPFSYRNRLAQYLRKQRKRIDVLDDNLKIKESRNLLYQELEKKRVDISYKKAKEKQQMALNADFRIFEEQLVN